MHAATSQEMHAATSHDMHAADITGLDDGHSIEIVDGLSGEELVVTGMLGRLAPNQRVRVIRDAQTPTQRSRP